MKQLTGGWSKYGGAKQHVIKPHLQPVWCCQSCGKQQPSEMPPFLWEFLPNEHLRVCAVCLKEDCQQLKKRRSS